MVGGYFNLCLNPTLDRCSSASGGSSRGSHYKEKVVHFMETLHLTDIWRHLHPNVKRFTFRRGAQSSRLDYWLLSDHLRTSDTLAHIIPEPLSDDEYISIKIGHSPTRKGPGVWRLDNSLLNNKEYIQKISETISDIILATELTDPGSL